MSESSYWGKVAPMLFGWDPQRIENKLGLGTPDVNHNHGWIELKYADDWPARKDTPFRVEHFTPEQKVWLRRRVHFGGRAHVLLGVGRDSLLFWGDTAADFLGQVPREKLFEVAAHFWVGGVGMKKELKNALLKDRLDIGRAGLLNSR